MSLPWGILICQDMENVILIMPHEEIMYIVVLQVCDMLHGVQHWRMDDQLALCSPVSFRVHQTLVVTKKGAVILPHHITSYVMLQ